MFAPNENRYDKMVYNRLGTADLRFPQFRSDYGRISASARILRLPRRWCIPHSISALLILI